MYFVEELIKRYFWKGYKYDEIVLLLEKRHHVQISKWSFQRYVNRPGLFRKIFHINSVSLLEDLEDVQQYLEKKNGLRYVYRNVQLKE